ncbi:MAG: helicase [Verrucomicrobia bacterium]|nr:helicase [Verrucomicrobiota bacterium]
MKATQKHTESLTDYQSFLERKTHLGNQSGFKPLFMPEFLFPFQRALTTWAVEKGRCAIFADCGLGKTPMQLVWAQNVVEKTCKPVLVLTPLSVGAQTIREAAKFGIEAKQSRDGTVAAPITVTNYQQLHKFDWKEFSGVVCDESSILKNFDGSIKSQVTAFMRKLPYRLLCTATAAPNDYIELGTSSEALGDLGFMDMLNRFFKKSEQTMSRREEFRSGLYRFRGHSEKDFWRWICSWARAVRKPSDIGFPDDSYLLPELQTVEHIITSRTRNPDFLFDMPAVGLAEQRSERRRTIVERCEQSASLIVNTGKPAVAWCHLNEEGHMLEKMIHGAVEVEGNDSDEFKEETFEAFASGQLRVLISKPVIAGFGLNWQHCAHQTFFPSHSFEQWYQAIRRCWRFGQTQPVRVDIISSEGEAGVLANLNRKAHQAEQMFAKLVELINNELRIEKSNTNTKQLTQPNWL